MGNITSELSNGIKIFESLYGFGKIVLVKARNRITTPYRVEKLSDDIFSSVISFGNVITVNGNFTKYGTTYRPLSYAPAIPAKSSERRIGYADPKTRRLQEKWENETKFRLFQFPVQTLPAFEDGKGRFCVAFLYPENFEGFILKGDPNKKGKSIADKLLIESMHQAIPILLPEETLENISESNVTLTGIVSLLPENVIDSISKDICTTREAFYYGFLRPYSSRIAFCIDCRDKINSDFSVNNKISSLPAALYIEGHFEGIVENKYEKEFNLYLTVCL